MRFTSVLVLCLPLVLTGCSLTPATTSTSGTPVNGSAIHGIVHGARQPISGAHVYLYAAGAGGYGTTSTSLLTSSVTVHNPGYYGQDGSGKYYVITDSNGNFSISSDYSCTSGAGVYLYSVGGDSGNGANSTIGLMAALGACPVAGNFASATPYVMVNEVSTIAAAYAMAGFATDATHVSSSGTTLALTGVQNAFANAANLANISTGLALAFTPSTSGSYIGTVPQATINTLADILAACINSSGSSSTQCSTLFSNAKSNGSSGTTALDTATAAINIAHNPWANITALYNIGGASGPFEPTIGEPNDFTIVLSFTGNGLSQPYGIAIDASGNAWVANAAGNSVSEFTSAGAVAGSSPFTGGNLYAPIFIAIDGTGNAWVTNEGSYPFSNSGVTKFTSAGAAVNSSPFRGGDLNEPEGIAFDASGNAWVANYNGPCCPYTYYVTKLTSISSATGYTGGGLSGSLGAAVDGSGNAWIGNLFNNSVSKFTSSGSGSNYSGGGLNYPQGIAIDHLGDVWVANEGNSSVSEFTNAGTAVGSGYTGGGLSSPYGIAIDGSGNVWVANNSSFSVTEYNSSGAAISGSSGYTGGGQNGPFWIAIDGSGNVWVTNYNNSVGSSLTEFIGAATPVITPIAAGLPASPSSDGSSNLGTRP